MNCAFSWLVGAKREPVLRGIRNLPRMCMLHDTDNPCGPSMRCSYASIPEPQILSVILRAETGSTNRLYSLSAIGILLKENGDVHIWCQLGSLHRVHRTH